MSDLESICITVIGLTLILAIYKLIRAFMEMDD